MAVRDYQALQGLELVPFDVEFDLARAVKSEAELESVRDSVRINQRGFEIWHEAYAPGKTAAEVMAAAEEWFVAEGCGRLTMNMVLTGTDTYARPEFKIARSDEALPGFVLPSLEVAGPGMHWVEVSRAVRAADAEPSDETKRMLEAYVEYYEVAQHRDARRCDVPRRAHGRLEGLHRPRLPPRPRHGALDRDDDDRVPEGGGGLRRSSCRRTWCFSMHPHAIAANGEDCLYMQDTWLVTADGGVPLADLAMEIWAAAERRSRSPLRRRATLKP